MKFADALPSSFAELYVGDQFRALGEKSDLQSNELKLNNVQSQQPLTIVVSQDTVLRRIPFAGARALAQRPAETAAGPQNGSAGNVQRVLEESPAINLADLQVGDMVLVSSTRGVDSSRLTAIVVAAGVEPLLRQRESSASQRPGTALTFGDFMDVGIGLPAN
ncbi:MAG: hypothetical protein ACRD1R_05295 [Acidobacteriota bacterium]